ncbi:hypothetical protein THAOC_00907 [Thalassiosira oceanica]|uniref:Uncharacterized protein n=1 Tax=Thalassiosira oceanica TaxID=159749 RepID=K0TI87_THAOC|nr:hypothetical protein THAOC_00907 [Thalassiosira oceanica]|eukprot:EJK77270.1 hypothetical protein THAOC_00907 [Thalassiosira oceanica]
MRLFCWLLEILEIKLSGPSSRDERSRNGDVGKSSSSIQRGDGLGRKTSLGNERAQNNVGNFGKDECTICLITNAAGQGGGGEKVARNEREGEAKGGASPEARAAHSLCASQSSGVGRAQSARPSVLGVGAGLAGPNCTDCLCLESDRATKTASEMVGLEHGMLVFWRDHNPSLRPSLNIKVALSILSGIEHQHQPYSSSPSRSSSKGWAPQIKKRNLNWASAGKWKVLVSARAFYAAATI